MNTTSKYLSPTNDVAFKKVFSDPKRLMHFLNPIMRLSESEKIISLEYIPQEQTPKLCEEKRTIVDIKVYDNTGKQYIVEMQNAYVESLLSRLEFYGSLAITSQLDVGGSYHEITPVVLVCITNNQKIAADLDVISYHKMVESKTGEVFFKNLSYVLVELSRFTKSEEEDLETLEDQWLYYMKYSEKSRHKPANLQSEEIAAAYTAIERFNWSKEEMEDYIKTQLAIESEKVTHEAKFKEGIEKGKKEGIKEGIEKGIEKGEKKRELEIAQNLLQEGLSYEQISKVTGLDLEIIKSMGTIRDH
jgi:predicted transposase/invertase (TIGR01784 family)